MSIERLKSVRVWAHGLGAAAVGGGASAITAMVLDPEKFNLSDLWMLAKAFLVSAIVSSAFYLVKSPLPPLPKEATEPQQPQQ